MRRSDQKKLKKKLKVEIEETGTEKKLQNTEMNGRGRVCSKIILTTEKKKIPEFGRACHINYSDNN